MADNSLNTQLQALHARLDRVDDDLISHYAGISQLVAGLAANPLTTGSVAPSLITYNFSSAGQTLLKKLLPLVPGYNQFKTLMHLDTAALLNGLESSLQSQVENMASTIAAQAEAAVLAKANALAAQVEAVANQATAIANQVTAQATQAQALANQIASGQALQNAINKQVGAAEIQALQAANNAANQALATAESALSSVTSIVNQANQAVASAEATVNSALASLNKITQTASAVNGFIATLTDIASGRTRSSIIK